MIANSPSLGFYYCHYVFIVIWGTLVGLVRIGPCLFAAMPHDQGWDPRNSEVKKHRPGSAKLRHPIREGHVKTQGERETETQSESASERVRGIYRDGGTETFPALPHLSFQAADGVPYCSVWRSRVRDLFDTLTPTRQQSPRLFEDDWEDWRDNVQL